MALIGNSIEEKIYNFLYDRIKNAFGVSGLMGNLFAESGLVPTNLQNSFEKKLGYTDDTYTTSVDNGDYTNFVHDSAGYGLAQWTYWSRKENLLLFVRSRNQSIGDLESQLEFLYQELSTGYKSVLAGLKSAESVREASDIVLTKYECPADQSVSVQEKRAGYGKTYYNKFAVGNTNSQNGGTNMSNSSLVNCTVKSPNHSGARTHSIDTLTPHCVVGQLSAESIGGCFTSSSRQASCNYGIGTDGRVVLCVDETNRSWCSSSNSNDQRAVTIECASDKTEPYAMNDAVYAKLVELCADICRRNGKTKVLWLGSKEKTLAYTPASNEMVLTAHRWFANKSCPGDWLYSRYGELAEKINVLLGTASGSTVTQNTNTDFPAVPFTVKVLVPDLNIRKTPAMGDNVVGQTGKGVFTITEVNDGWGKLKSGAGWIYLENKEYVTVLGGSSSGGSQTAAPVKKSVDEVAKEVLRGDWGNGADRKKRLEASGYNYAQVQAAVNRLCK